MRKVIYWLTALPMLPLYFYSYCCRHDRNWVDAAVEWHDLLIKEE